MARISPRPRRTDHGKKHQKGDAEEDGLVGTPIFATATLALFGTVTAATAQRQGMVETGKNSISRLRGMYVSAQIIVPNHMNQPIWFGI